MDIIPYGRQDISEADIEAVVEVLRSDFLTQGPVVPEFERQLARYAGAQHGVAVNSATSALHLACLALGVGQGDVVWTTPITFVASANCALYCGAQVDFVDVDLHTGNMSAQALELKLAASKKSGGLPRVVIPVHLCGNPCDMEKIHALALQYGFRVIEDASHAIGGNYRGQKIGNCRFSDITVFSFHPVKLITTGEGGVALTNDGALARKMQLLRSHGITREPDEMTQAPDGPWYYQQIMLGYNYRMTDIQAALGLSQLKRLDEFIQKRQLIASRYHQALSDLPLALPQTEQDDLSAFHLYVVRMLTTHPAGSHLHAFEYMRENGILVNLHYIPVYRQPYYQKMGYRVEDYPQSEAYYTAAISLPIYPGLQPEQQDRVIHTLRQALA